MEKIGLTSNFERCEENARRKLYERYVLGNIIKYPIVVILFRLDKDDN